MQEFYDKEQHSLRLQTEASRSMVRTSVYKGQNMFKTKGRDLLLKEKSFYIDTEATLKPAMVPHVNYVPPRGGRSIYGIWKESTAFFSQAR